MTALFIELLNMSISAGWLILLILVFRRVFHNTPKWMNYLLWAVVAFRLICPVSIESVLSLVPSQQTISQDIIYEKYPTIESGSVEVNNIVNPVISTVFEATPEYSANPIQITLAVASQIWFLGLLAFLIYGVVSYIRIRSQVQEAVLIEENIWQCDHVATPFLLGLLRPRIYVPSCLNEEQMKYVIAHERAHIRHRDYLWKPIGFCLLAVYWFNPLIWMAYIALCKDIEYACDEKVIEDMNGEEKKAYTTALLECSVPRHMISACPVAFGEVGVEKRVKTVLHYKKPAFWITIVAVLLCIGVAVGFLTNPAQGGNVSSNICGTYIIESSNGASVSATYLTLQEDGIFVAEDSIDPNSLGELERSGTYEVKDDTIILQIEEANYTLKVNGDKLVFEDVETAEDFIINLWHVDTTVENEALLRVSSAVMLEQGYPEEVVVALDNATKDMLVGEYVWPPTTYIEYYYDKDGNATSYERRTGIVYQEPENIEDYVLKLSILPMAISTVSEEEDVTKLDKMKVIGFYEWLQPPSTLGREYKMTMAWTLNHLSMETGGFRKIDKYVFDGQEYIQSYEPGYARGGQYEVSWYTDIKGTMGSEPERIYGAALVELENQVDVGAINMNIFLEYQIGMREYDAVVEFSWKPTDIQ